MASTRRRYRIEIDHTLERWHLDQLLGWGRETYLPDQEREELLKFAQVLNGINIAVGEPRQAMLVGPDGKQVPIPAELFQVLEEAANVLALGDGISILPYSAKLTTRRLLTFSACPSDVRQDPAVRSHPVRDGRTPSARDVARRGGLPGTRSA